MNRCRNETAIRYASTLFRSHCRLLYGVVTVYHCMDSTRPESVHSIRGQSVLGVVMSPYSDCGQDYSKEAMN